MAGISPSPQWCWGGGGGQSTAPLGTPSTARFRPRRGIFGGTFDPPHIGHLVLAEFARAELGLSEVVFLPAAQPPHKQDRAVLPIADRLAMVRLAMATNPDFVLSRLDIDRPGPNYTVETLELFHKLWGHTTQVYFILGLDSLIDLPRWYQPTRILQLAQLAVMARPDYHVDMALLERALPGISERIIFIPAPMIGISSTEIRERAARRKTIKYLVPQAVEVYIRDHALYQPVAAAPRGWPHTQG